MSQNRAGLTFEALIHENKKRPNNRLQMILNQKLQNLENMRSDSERLYRKQKSDLARRQQIYNRILGSLTRNIERDTGTSFLYGHERSMICDLHPPTLEREETAVGLATIAVEMVREKSFLTEPELVKEPNFLTKGVKLPKINN